MLQNVIINGIYSNTFGGGLYPGLIIGRFLLLLLLLFTGAWAYNWGTYK